MSVGGNTAPQIAKDIGDRAFFFVFGDNVQAAAMAEFACEQGYKNAWIIGSEEIPYTKDMPKYFKDAFDQCGGAIAGEDVYKIGQTEFRTQVTKIQNADPAPDVIFTPMFVPDSGIFLKALRGAGVQTPFLGTDGNDSTLFADSGGDAVDGAVFSTHGFAGEGAVADFLADFEQVTGAAAESNTFEAIGRDNVYALVAAVKAAGGSVEPDDLKTAIKGLKDVPLLTGNMTMDPATHIPIKDVTLIRMNGTTQELVQTKTPGLHPRLRDIAGGPTTSAVRYGPLVAVHGVRLRVEAGEIVDGARRQRRGQVVAARRGGRPRAGRRRADHASTASRSRTCRPSASSGWASRSRPRAGACSRA